MKIIYNSLLPIPGYSAMMFFGVILARKSCAPLSPRTIRHEQIHVAQAKDCGGYIPYYIRYITQWIKYGYRNSPFEREAYDNEQNIAYLSIRTKNAWKTYIK